MDVARYPGLMQRRTRWYLRAKLPVDLVATLGRSEIWKSLGSGDHAVAVKLHRRARADLDDWFSNGAGVTRARSSPASRRRWSLAGLVRAIEALPTLDYGLAGDQLAAEDVPVTRDKQTMPALSSDEGRQIGHNSGIR